jgi:hypothetical protein
VVARSTNGPASLLLAPLSGLVRRDAGAKCNLDKPSCLMGTTLLLKGGTEFHLLKRRPTKWPLWLSNSSNRLCLCRALMPRSSMKSLQKKRKERAKIWSTQGATISIAINSSKMKTTLRVTR